MESDHPRGLRGRIWKILLRIPKVDVDEYLALVQKKDQTLYRSICNDTFRSFGKDYKFRERVPDAKLIRTVSALVQYCKSIKSPIGYIQAMSKLIAPFLYVMPEADAFFCFRRFALCCCPSYFMPNIPGVFGGLAVCLYHFPFLHPFLFA